MRHKASRRATCAAAYSGLQDYVVCATSPSTGRAVAGLVFVVPGIRRSISWQDRNGRLLKVTSAEALSREGNDPAVVDEFAALRAAHGMSLPARPLVLNDRDFENVVQALVERGFFERFPGAGLDGIDAYLLTIPDEGR